MLASAGLAAGGGLAGAGAYRLGSTEASTDAAAIPFHGRHQAGIATQPQGHLLFAAYDLVATSQAELQQLLRAWSSAAERLCSGRPARPSSPEAGGGQDPGEADGLDPASLTLTFGLGPTIFERDGHDRFGLRNRRPAALEQIPTLPGDELQPYRSYGDLCVQACADDPQVAFHGIHVLTLAAHGVAVPRWSQAGFLPGRAAGEDRQTPRNLMGYKDGTNNLRPQDQAAMSEHVWVTRRQEPAWMGDGTYLVARRIRMLLDVWDTLTIKQQDQTVGRHKHTGAPLGRHSEHDPIDLSAAHAGVPTIPTNAHVRLAAASENGGARILRRGYSYFDGVDQATGQIDAGLFFVSFQRDPAHFTTIQRRLGVKDALAKHLSHTSSAVFACPPGIRQGGYVGERLFAAT